MMNIYHEQSKNVWKTWLLMGTFLALIVAIGYFFSYTYSNPVIFYIAIIFSIVMNVAGYWFSDKIVLAMYRAQEVSNGSYPDLYNIVENLSITAGLPMPKVYVIPDPAPNAFATGRNKEHAAVAVTSGLLERLNRTELEGVIAHELSHIGNRDILIATIVVVLVGFVSILADMFARTMWRGGDRSERRGGPAAVLAIVGIIFIILSPIFAKLIQLAISRKREYLADASGALLTRYPEGLASALEKISSYPGELAHANGATAHLFISNPFGSAKKVASLFATHPPAEDRIRILRGMQ